MKAYLDLNNGRVEHPPFRQTFVENSFIKNTPINAQLYFLSYGDKIITYAPYERFAALIAENEYEYLLSHPISDKYLSKDLIYGKFYGVERIDTTSIHISNFSPAEITVFLGDACNLSCVYCNAVSGRDGNFNPDKTVTAVNILLEKYPIKHISFYGNGEPLLYFKTLKQIVTMGRNQGIESLYVVTSGMLDKNTKEYVRFLVENKIYTQISIDGYEEIHDLQRPLQNGKGSFNYIMRTINEFKKYGDLNKYCFARFSLTEYASMHLKEIILFLYEIGFRKIRMAELIPEGRADELSEFTRAPEPMKIVDQVVEALLLADDRRINFTGDYDPRSPSEAGIFPCPYMGGKAFSLNKNLDILCCLEDYEKWRIGRVNLQNQSVNINEDKLSKIQRRNMLAFEDCISCPVKCGCGCTHYSWLKHKSLSMPGDYKEKCEALRMILTKYLKEKLIGGKI